MGKIHTPEKVKLFCAALYHKDFDIDGLSIELEKRWGPADLVSGGIPFVFTDYYDREMSGPGLLKKLFSFAGLIEMGDLAGIKNRTNEIEAGHQTATGRRCNIDPGYLCLSKLVLASTKDFSHRIYIGDNIFGEVTLLYRNNDFVPLEWTYPDYKSPEFLGFFRKMRNLYREEIHGKK